MSSLYGDKNNIATLNNVNITHDAFIGGKSIIQGDTNISGNVNINKNTTIYGNTNIHGNTDISGSLSVGTNKKQIRCFAMTIYNNYYNDYFNPNIPQYVNVVDQLGNTYNINEWMLLEFGGGSGLRLNTVTNLWQIMYDPFNRVIGKSQDWGFQILAIPIELYDNKYMINSTMGEYSQAG